MYTIHFTLPGKEQYNRNTYGVKHAQLHTIKKANFVPFFRSMYNKDNLIIIIFSIIATDVLLLL